MTDPSKALFDDYRKFYESKRLTDYSLVEVKALRLDRLPRWLNRVDEDARVLDAGCAEGYLLSLLHESGFHNLSGVDLSLQLVDVARHRLPESVSITVSDVRDYLTQSPDASFDVILFHHVLEHIPREFTIGLLREFRRCLSPGGFLSVKVPNAISLSAGYACFGDFTHVVHFNEFSLLQVAEAAGFTREHCEFIFFPPELFWSWSHAGRAGLRVLNRLRWHLNNQAHRWLFRLTDLHPMPQVFGNEIELLAVKTSED